MITITRYEDGFTVDGHAGYAEYGKDIVCAAVSALLQAFCESVRELTTDELKCVISAGRAVIRYEALTEDAQLLLNSFFIGIKMIEGSYPEYVVLKKGFEHIKIPAGIG